MQSAQFQLILMRRKAAKVTHNRTKTLFSTTELADVC